MSPDLSRPYIHIAGELTSQLVGGEGRERASHICITPFDSVMEGQGAREFLNFTFSHLSPIPPVGTTSRSTFDHMHAESIAECSSLQSVLQVGNGNAHDKRSFCNNQHDFSLERTGSDTTCYSHADSIAKRSSVQPISSYDQVVAGNAHDESFVSKNERFFESRTDRFGHNSLFAW